MVAWRRWILKHAESILQGIRRARSTRRLLLLLVEGLGVFLFPHHGILSRHPSVKCPLELGTQGQLGHVLGLLLAQYYALLHESLVLHAVEALFDVGDLERYAVGGADGRGYRGSDAVGAISEGGASLRSKRNGKLAIGIPSRQMARIQVVIRPGRACDETRLGCSVVISGGVRTYRRSHDGSGRLQRGRHRRETRDAKQQLAPLVSCLSAAWRRCRKVRWK